MNREQAKPLLVAAQHAAEWCRGKLELRAGAGGFGKEFEHRDSERAALHVAHSLAVAEVVRLQAIIAG
ncbi:MAG TPA: hypothetical protein VHH11_19530 [Gammaproteobacteria bacterium]|jgi:hypothetical protein|nr:hypothetical protein [Gammaproteobacteria bacterium]